MLQAICNGRLAIFWIDVIDPEILSVPRGHRVAKQSCRLRPDVGKHPRLAISHPRDGVGGLQQHAKTALAPAQILFSALAIGNVDARTDISLEGSVGIEAGHPDVEKPTIFAIKAPQPILHLEVLTGIEGPAINVQASLQVV